MTWPACLHVRMKVAARRQSQQLSRTPTPEQGPLGPSLDLECVTLLLRALEWNIEQVENLDLGRDGHNLGT